MKVVLFNTAIGTTNNGDFIIYENAKRGIQPLLEKSFVMEFGTHLNNLGILHYCVHSSKVSFADSCDYKFVLGTNLLTSNMWRSIRQWPVGPFNRLIYKNCIMMGTGITYDKTKMDLFTRQMYQQILRKDIVHSVRDEKSKKMLETISGVKAINTGCPTLWGLTPDVCDKIPVKKAKNAVVSVSGYKSQIDKKADQILVDTMEANYDKIYLWVQTIEDEHYYKELNHKKEAVNIYSLYEFKRLCENGNVDYIGTRLHGGIFAMQNLVRTIIIEIDHRASGFREDNHINTISRANIEELEDYLNCDVKTEIVLRESEIKDWLSQFPNCVK